MRITTIRRFGIAAALFLSAGCADGFKVYPAAKAPGDRRYLYYALPRTVLIVTVPVTKTIATAGDCTLNELADEIAGVPSPSSPGGGSPAEQAKPGGGAKPRADAQGAPPTPAASTLSPDKAAARDKATRMLRDAGIEPFDPARASELEIGDVTVSSRAEPDPENVYAIALSSDILTNNKYGFEISDQGLLSSASIESTSTAYDYTTKVIGAAANIAAAAIGFGGAGAPAGTCRSVLDELKKVRAARRDLVEGKGNTQGLSKEALELMLSELQGIERGFVARFAGTRSTRQGTIVCEYTPGAATERPVELFSFTQRGVAAASPGCVVLTELRDPDTSEGAGKILIGIRREAAIADKARAPEGEGAEGERGIYYRIPARGFVELLRIDPYGQKSAAAERVASGWVDVAQFGRVMSLPGDDDVGAASINYTVRLSPTTGALLSYGAGARGADSSSLVEQAERAGTTVLDAVQSKLERDAEAEVKALEQEKKRLELLRDVQKLRREVR